MLKDAAAAVTVDLSNDRPLVETGIFDAKPLADNVVFQMDVVPSEFITKGGIIAPDVHGQGKFNTQSGIVLAVGPGYRNADGSYAPLQVKVGDRIAFNHTALFRCKVAEKSGIKEFTYISERNIVAIIPAAE